VAAPYLAHYFGPGPLHATFTLKVFTLQGVETFEPYGYRLDAGHLILYRAEEAENNSVRLDPFAVFAPGGWIGYALSATDKQKLAPIGFEFRPPEPD
jgi:hypothetical protein